MSSAATKRKHVVREMLNEYPEPTEGQVILKILGARGNNLHEAQWPEGGRHLCSMPTKFRKNVWITQGQFVIADRIEEGDKVKAEMVFILYKDQIKHLKRIGVWPTQWTEEEEAVAAAAAAEEEAAAAEAEAATVADVAAKGAADARGAVSAAPGAEAAAGVVDATAAVEGLAIGSESESELSDDSLEGNPNHRRYEEAEPSSSEESESD